MSEIVYTAYGGITFRNNLFVGTAETSNTPFNGPAVVENGWYWKVGTANGDEDPRFVDFNGDDYRLTSYSPLIGQAQNLSQYYSTDFAGVTLPTSGPWDIGAYLFVETKCDLNDDYKPDLLSLALFAQQWLNADRGL
jgi:hypothetical protein